MHTGHKQIALLVDGDLVLSESLAINLYLAKQRRSSLYPQDAASEARIWQWTIWAASDIEMPLITALVQRGFLRRLEKRARAIDKLSAVILLESYLDSGAEW